jgi:ribonuclease P protein component
MTGLRLYKCEKLCSCTAIDNVFAKGASVIAYPLRAAYRITDVGQAPVRFLITIPKKKIHTAVGRVLMRRRVREAYRLNRQLVFPAIEAAGKSVDIAFIYLHGDEVPYSVIEAKMKVLLTAISTAVTPKTPDNE